MIIGDIMKNNRIDFMQLQNQRLNRQREANFKIDDNIQPLEQKFVLSKELLEMFESHQEENEISKSRKLNALESFSVGFQIGQFACILFQDKDQNPSQANKFLQNSLRDYIKPILNQKSQFTAIDIFKLFTIVKQEYERQKNFEQEVDDFQIIENNSQKNQNNFGNQLIDDFIDDSNQFHQSKSIVKDKDFMIDDFEFTQQNQHVIQQDIFNQDQNFGQMKYNQQQFENDKRQDHGDLFKFQNHHDNQLDEDAILAQKLQQEEEEELKRQQNRNNYSYNQNEYAYGNKQNNFIQRDSKPPCDYKQFIQNEQKNIRDEPFSNIVMPKNSYNTKQRINHAPIINQQKDDYQNEDQELQRAIEFSKQNQKKNDINQINYQEEQILSQDELKQSQLQKELEELESKKLMRQLMKKDEEERKEFERKRKEQEKVNREAFTCQICLESLFNIKQKPMVLENCQHIFCKDCLGGHVKQRIADRNFPILCPACNTNLHQTNIEATLDSKQEISDFQEKQIKHYGETNPDMSWCPTPDCKYMFEYKKGDPINFSCLVCKKAYCLDCRVEQHNGLSCEQYKENKIDEPFMEFVRGSRLKQCNRCKFWVQKNEGCNHMTCRCKYEFCYVCGGPWPHNAQNPCRGS